MVRRFILFIVFINAIISNGLTQARIVANVTENFNCSQLDLRLINNFQGAISNATIVISVDDTAISNLAFARIEHNEDKQLEPINCQTFFKLPLSGVHPVVVELAYFDPFGVAQSFLEVIPFRFGIHNEAEIETSSLGITDFNLRESGYIELVNFSKKPIDGQIKIITSPQFSIVPRKEDFSIAAGQKKKLIFSLPSALPGFKGDYQVFLIIQYASSAGSKLLLRSGQLHSKQFSNLSNNQEFQVIMLVALIGISFVILCIKELKLLSSTKYL